MRIEMYCYKVYCYKVSDLLVRIYKVSANREYCYKVPYLISANRDVLLQSVGFISANREVTKCVFN